jgi:CrcB protein
MYSYLIVFVGAGIGGSLRHGTNLVTSKWFGTGFPYGTLTVNVVGSLVMGVFAGYFAFKGEASQPWRLFLATGVLGGFTTFSSFSLDMVALWERNELVFLAVYAAASLVISVVGLLIGLYAVRGVLS